MNLFFITLVAFLITFISVPFIIKFAKRYGLVDNPKERPHPAHLHKTTIPRAGGLACFIGIIISSLLFLPMEKYLVGIIFGLLILLIVGLIDDRKKSFSPLMRLLCQFLAAAFVVASGVGISFVTNPLGGIIRLDEIVYQIDFFGPHNIILIADLIALFWIVWVMNMVNWANGVDGQTPGFIAIAALLLGVYSFGLYQAGDGNQLKIAILSFTVAGASLGFLPFNWHPAKIFLGFSGTTILGFMIAVLAILSGAKLAIALLILLVPAVDSIYTGLRRILTGKSPFYGDQKHLHHLLLKRGWSHPQIALFYILISAILGAAAINLDSKEKLFAAVLVSSAILGLILWLNFFGDFSKQSDPDNG
jgi:UDP-GlcNAc:undecaprenyl-phosphate/decaprenyl-phosphate GlcNAc-1-phosphate transferase